MITLTERASAEVKRIISEQGLPDGSALRVGVKGGGCSGFSYTLGFDDQVGDTDQVSQVGDVRVVCDPKSSLYLNGTETDYQHGRMGRGRTFRHLLQGASGQGEGR